MSPINIICKVNDAEDFKIDKSYIDFNINNNEKFSYTFWNKQLKRLSGNISAIGLDILCLSLFVFGADRIIPRKDTVDCWTRDINLYVPVLELEKWNENKLLVENMLKYLSGDRWNIIFRKREFSNIELQWKSKIQKAKGTKLQVDKICMFSGGLDSFIGVIDSLEESKEKIAFVSLYGGGKGVKEYQDRLRAEMVKVYHVGEDNFFSFYAAVMDGQEDTTRTRSLMFFCHAIALATSMNSDVNLIIPENGLISLNIPLTNSRLGSSSTRTTHPYYIRMLQELLRKLDIKVTISNPYQFKTKGEMMQQCKNISLLTANVTNTMSCSHPDHGRRIKETESCHCGYCLPCVIRRAAIKKSGIEDSTKYRDSNFTSGDTAKINLNSYLLGLAKYNPAKAFLTIQKSGEIVSDIDAYANLYSRGMLELKCFLEDFNEFV